MSNDEQIAYWNGEAGRKWADRDTQMARILAPVAEALMDHAGLDGARAALDVGCGGGSNTFMLAERLGPDACVLGIDVSAPMLGVAEARKDAQQMPTVGFLQADAATHDFGDTRFDLLFSRFGVMFFDDPAAAFANLRRAMVPAAQLAFACWQPLSANPWTALPLKAALTVLPPPEPPAPRSPGPFAFAEPAYVKELLAAAGWRKIAVEPHALEMRWPAEADYAATVRELVNTGPVGRLLAEVDEASREAVYRAAEGALESFYTGDELSLPGAIWLVTAKNED